MKKKYLSWFLALFTVCSLSLTSCGLEDILENLDDDDDDEPEYVEPNEPDEPNAGELVSGQVPSFGWSGNADNGILKYNPDEDVDDDLNIYYAFKMKGGVCETAMANIVFENASMARQIAKMLNDGSWAQMDDDDDDDYYATRTHGNALDMTRAILKHANRLKATRAAFSLPIPVKQSGKVIYFVMPNFKGLTQADMRIVMKAWNEYADDLPDHVIFGKYENGTYICENMHGLDITYVINTEFNANGFCDKYVTHITLPTQAWAQFYYEVYDGQLDDLEAQFGKRPTLSINGNTITLDAVIIGEVTHADVDRMIITLDLMNNCPLLCNMFS